MNTFASLRPLYLQDYLEEGDPYIPFCLASFNRKLKTFPTPNLELTTGHPFYAVGLEGGSVLIFDASKRPRYRIKETARSPLMASLEKDHKNSIFDASLTYDDTLMATSSSAVVVTDLTEGKTLHTLSIPDAGHLKQVQFSPMSNSLVAASSRSGRIALFDLRASSQRSVAGVHDVKNGKVKRANVSVTSIAWARENVLASAGENDLTVKFWDMRTFGHRARTVPKNVASPEITTKDRNYGITSLVKDPTNQKVWALGRNGRVYSYFDCQPQAHDTLSCDDLSVQSFYTKFTVITPSVNNAGSYIACAGHKGVVLFPNPTTPEATTTRDHALLTSPTCSSDVTGIAFQKHAGALVSLSDDGVMRLWDADPDLYNRVRNTTENFSDNGSDVALAAWANPMSRRHP